ncbi:GNAT family N-acetyltransferase [Erythrobacter arachoides]|uniref:GNAT family N-acetyltransferase n=1 Tax=Aurantiacibacter arachoides TaxID=1850444 RepID=A0A845A4A8_9SPHN|nr:GNAT family N-acetyltransferase [Aurantiacibacter arachoides]MXO93747.1 GNAT family N-acetyltransferase [Aurantiacibacter arachoides]GGD46942.1 N-acetyltransferase [Aurantiacibacter arachoides]
MFMRTQRLFLRPAWIEDAPAVAHLIAEPEIVRNLARAPWPYGLAEAEAFVTMPQDPKAPHFLLHLPGQGVIGSAGFGRQGAEVEIGYWIGRRWWGQGFATEAAAALLDLARMIGHRRLVAGHFADNPRSGSVLRKVGFVPTGTVARRHSEARGEDAALVEFACDLEDQPAPREWRSAA